MALLSLERTAKREPKTNNKVGSYSYDSSNIEVIQLYYYVCNGVCNYLNYLKINTGLFHDLVYC